MLYEVITGYDGVARTSGNKELVGKDLTQFKDVDGKIIHEKFMDRITSYNVCYTKLLRLHSICNDRSSPNNWVSVFF